MTVKMIKALVGFLVLLALILFGYQRCTIQKLRKAALAQAVANDQTLKAEAERWASLMKTYLDQKAADHLLIEAVTADAAKAKADLQSVKVMSRAELKKALDAQSTIAEQFTLLSKEHEVALVALDKANVALSASEQKCSVLSKSLTNAEKTIDLMQKERGKTVIDMTNLAAQNLVLVNSNRKLKNRELFGAVVLGVVTIFAVKSWVTK